MFVVEENESEDVFSDEEFEAELKQRQRRGVLPRGSQVSQTMCLSVCLSVSLSVSLP